MLRTALLIVLALFASWFVFGFVRGLFRTGSWRPGLAETATGFVTVFFDTLGIGSFATTTTIFRAWRLVPDELIPGTLNVGHMVTSVLGAFIFIQLVPVAASTLLPMIAASGIGAWLGAGIVARLPRHRVRLGMGTALVAAASIMLGSQLGLLPGGGSAAGLSGVSLAVAVAGNIILGGLMTLGIGLYAPCMILVSLLGMNPRAAFPIMMGSCAFLMTISGTRFVRAGRYQPSAAVGLTLGGIPALLIAALLVKALPLEAVRWLVVIVVFYTALTLLQAGRRELASLQGGPAIDLGASA
jgi:uncharacterized membrane protein YfcA